MIGIPGKTIAEKIFSAHSGTDARAGDIVIAGVDFVMGQDGTSPLAIKALERMGVHDLFDPEKVAVVIDHSAPSPLEGVLAAFARRAGDAWRPAVVNLGRRPAVGGGEPLLEVHFFDLEADLYGQRLEVQFVAKLRDEAHFETLDALVAQMHQDAQTARALLAEAEVPGPDA